MFDRLKIYRTASVLLDEIMSGRGGVELSKPYQGSGESFNLYSAAISLLEDDLKAISHNGGPGYSITNAGRSLLYSGGVVKNMLLKDIVDVIKRLVLFWQ